MGAGPPLPPRDRAALKRGPGEGPGWAKLAEAVAAEVPPAEIDTIYLFRPLRVEGREWGTAVIARRAPDAGFREPEIGTAAVMLRPPTRDSRHSAKQ